MEDENLQFESDVQFIAGYLAGIAKGPTPDKDFAIDAEMIFEDDVGPDDVEYVQKCIDELKDRDGVKLVDGKVVQVKDLSGNWVPK